MLLPVAAFVHDVLKLIELLTLVQATCPALRNADERVLSEEAGLHGCLHAHRPIARVCMYSAM